MGLYESIQTTLQKVPTLLAPAASWSCRRLTSGPAAEARTYSAWTSVDAHVTGRTTAEAFDAQGVWRRKEIARFRISSAIAELHQGDQVRDGSSAQVTYAVTGIESSGIGTNAYRIERDILLKAESVSRNGGV